MEDIMEWCTTEKLEFHAFIARKSSSKEIQLLMGNFSHPNVLVQEAEYKEANANEGVVVLNREPVVLVKWKARPPSVYRVNWDVVIDSTNRWMVIGIIV
ncbi:hypothetical protein SLA2020_419280 [Shorea laevis]